MAPRPRYRAKRSNKVSLKVAKEFWRYMRDTNQLLATRNELRKLYKNVFKSTLNDDQKKVQFGEVMWYFRSKQMKVIEWKEANDRENIVYLQGRRVTVNQAYTMRREETSRENNAENQDDDLGDRFAQFDAERAFAELKKKLVTGRKNLVLNKYGIRIQPKHKKKGIIHMSGYCLQLTVENRQDTKVELKCAILGSPGPFVVDDRIHQIVSQSKTALLPGNGSIDFTVTIPESVNPGSYSIAVAFMFNRENKPELFHIVKYIRAEVPEDDEIVKRLQPKKLYVRPKPIAIVNDPDVKTERGEPPYVKSPNYVVELNSYLIPGNLRHQMNIGQLESVFSTYNVGQKYTPASHCAKFSKLLHVEELQMEFDIERYKMPKAKLVEDGVYLTLGVPGLAENRPSLVRGDHLFVRELAADGSFLEKKKYQGYVHRVELNKVFLKFSASFHRHFTTNTSYQVDFKFSRTPLKVMHRTMENAVPYLSLIPFDGGPSIEDNNLESARLLLKGCNIHAQQLHRIIFYDQKLERNAEQKQAVENILAGTSKPYPYLVFGPPGTGKTVTMVEAIKQVLKNRPDSRVLACAPSNSAADLMLERVAQHNVVPKSQMVRLNAFGRSESSVNKNIKEFCIRDDDGFFGFPSKLQIEQNYRLVVTTLMSAGRLVSLGIPKSHFSHVFIDEAGQGMEPECLVPIVGFVEIQDVNGGQLVLAGDPKQLGPVLRSPVAIEHGLSMSFLERLMGPNFPCYNRQEPNDNYDPKVVTKLLNNYRSHPNIIEVPNNSFYDDELRACADETLRESLCNWSGLKKRGFPVIFEAVCGKDQREEKSPSFFNPEEVSVVLRYVKSLKEARGIPLKSSEIGIISPYHRQVQKIRQELQKTLKIQDIKVGSVEEFQGQERKVIIISTVRSSEEFLQLDAEFKLGFLKNPKRFNVAITRAKALLIVIGNPDVLCHDEHWRKFIQFCMDNESISGVPFEMPEVVDRTTAAKLEDFCITESSLFDTDPAEEASEETPWRSDEQ